VTSGYAYLGPAGTFSEAAALALDADPDELVPLSSISGVLRSVAEGDTTRGVVPIENRLEGGVTATLLALADDVDLLMTGEVELPVELLLAAAPGTAFQDVREVASHPVALGACRRYLATTMEGVPTRPVASTALGAAVAAQEQGVAAIANPLAIERHGLEVLEDQVADVSTNRTRFVEVGRSIPPRTGWDKTSIVVYLPGNEPGSLLRILEILAERDLDMTRLESRPTEPELGSYRFFIDIAGHLDDERVADGLAALHRTQREVKLLGAYPRADARPEDLPDLDVDDATFRSAVDWVRDWRDRIR
jgi:prephenate dehydratase